VVGKWSAIKLSPGGRKVCCPLEVVEMVEEGCPLEDVGVA